MASSNSFPVSPAGVDLSGQVALVTGATSGLGRNFALTLAAHGAQVVATGRRVERLESLRDEIVDAGGRCLPLALDVTDAEQLVGVVAEAESTVGPVTILVNNAGIPDAQYATKMTLELIDGVLDTNLRAPFILSCEVARRLIGHGLPGRIVNISSIGAFNYGGGASALYSVSKAGVNRLTEALAVEWSKFHINVNAIAPGMFASEMTDGMLQRIGDVTGSFPRKRLGQPSQLDSTLLYLVSPASDAVTGTVIKVDDGQAPR